MVYSNLAQLLPMRLGQVSVFQCGQIGVNPFQLFGNPFRIYYMRFSVWLESRNRSGGSIPPVGIVGATDPYRRGQPRRPNQNFKLPAADQEEMWTSYINRGFKLFEAKNDQIVAAGEMAWKILVDIENFDRDLHERIKSFQKSQPLNFQKHLLKDPDYWHAQDQSKELRNRPILI